MIELKFNKSVEEAFVQTDRYINEMPGESKFSSVTKVIRMGVNVSLKRKLIIGVKYCIDEINPEKQIINGTTVTLKPFNSTVKLNK